MLAVSFFLPAGKRLRHLSSPSDIHLDMWMNLVFFHFDKCATNTETLNFTTIACVVLYNIHVG